MIWALSHGWIGVDIGTSTVKVVQLERHGQQLRIAAAAAIRRQQCWPATSDQTPLETRRSSSELQAALSSVVDFRGRIAAAVLLFLYYIATPPFVGLVYSVPMEGSYLIVNKVLIELVAVLVLIAFPTSMSFGLDRLIFWKKTQESQATA